VHSISQKNGARKGNNGKQKKNLFSEPSEADLNSLSEYLQFLVEVDFYLALGKLLSTTTS
jgi:hypothetical protein